MDAGWGFLKGIFLSNDKVRAVTTGAAFDSIQFTHHPLQGTLKIDRLLFMDIISIPNLKCSAATKY